MVDKLADFMVEMATSNKLKELYAKNPKKLMQIYELDHEDIKLLIEKKYELIQKRLGANYRIAHNTQVTAYRVKS